MRKLYTNYYHDLNPDPKLASFCKNIGNETMNVYGIKSIDEFISPNADRNENLKEAMGLIRACEYGSGPFEDVSAAFNALEAYDTVSYCEMVKDPDIKTKCISAVNQANQLDN